MKETIVGDPRLAIGGNNPPDTFDAHAAHIDDLYIEAGNWCDGADIENEGQAAVVDDLIAAFKTAIDDAKASEVAATKPLQDEVKTIQQRYWPLIGETKTITGKAVRAKTTLLAVKTRWGNKLETIRRAEADRLRKIADEQAAEAAKAAREAVGNLEATEQAEDLIRTAQDTLKAAKQAEKPAVKGMRDAWTITGFAETTDGDGMPVDGRGVLLRHYLKTRPDSLVEACLELARQDVRDGKRAVPGLLIENIRKAV